MTAVFKHELKSYFHSLSAYVFGAGLLLAVGLGALRFNLQAAVSNFEFALSYLSIIFAVIVPILTMRVIAEERRQKTDQLLYALPITTTQIVVGKYLALLAVYMVPLGIIALYPLMFAQFGEVYLLTSYGAMLAFFIMGAALIALGVFISSLTDSQGFAAGMGIAVILLNYYSVSLSEYVSATVLGTVAALCAAILALGAVIRHLTGNWVVQSGQEDAVMENLLSKYDSLSEHVEVVKKNPDVYPAFAEQYTDKTVQNNSLIVECGDRSRYIGYDDIYIQTADLYSYTCNTSFDGEGAITSAIDYVVSEELPRVYLLEGHGEQELPASFQDQIEKENMAVEALSLLTVDQIPEDAGCLMIYAPKSDISETERDLLAGYAAQGGTLLVAAGPVEDGILENLYSLLADYGVKTCEGIVVEGDRGITTGFRGPGRCCPSCTATPSPTR